MSNALAQSLLKAQKDQANKDDEENKQKGPDNEDNDKKKKYEPLSKWQKIGYIMLGISLGGGLIGNGILFCKYQSVFNS